MMDDLKEFLEARNKAVAGSLDDFVKYSLKQGAVFPNSEVAEITYHKCRTAVKALSTEARQSSHEWLASRGYESWIG